MRRILAAVVLGGWVGACGGGDVAAPAAPSPVDGGAVLDSSAPASPDAEAGSVYDWRLPPGFPAPRVPADNPMNDAKVVLGRRLFYDRRLSKNGTQSCGSCHQQSKAFTDGRAVGVGSTGQAHRRGPQSLANVAYASTLTWANPLMTSLEKQVLVPLFGDDPVELGMGSPDDVVVRVASDPEYTALLGRAFPGAAALTFDHVAKAIAAFERTLIAGDSSYDRYQLGDKAALGPAEIRGMKAFFSEKLECYHCHGGFLFSDSAVHAGTTFFESLFHNTGLYNLDGKGAYPDGNRGVFEISAKPDDMGRFRAPSLRNVALTAPYFHDGTAATLEDVLDHYASGGRTLTSGPHAGVGSTNPLKSELVRGFTFADGERDDVIAFLRSLTSPSLLTDPRFSDPFPKDPTDASP